MWERKICVRPAATNIIDQLSLRLRIIFELQSSI
jgi:hypothetical protein